MMPDLALGFLPAFSELKVHMRACSRQAGLGIIEQRKGVAPPATGVPSATRGHRRYWMAESLGWLGTLPTPLYFKMPGAGQKNCTFVKTQGLL